MYRLMIEKRRKPTSSAFSLPLEIRSKAEDSQLSIIDGDQMLAKDIRNIGRPHGNMHVLCLV